MNVMKWEDETLKAEVADPSVNDKGMPGSVTVEINRINGQAMLVSRGAKHKIESGGSWSEIRYELTGFCEKKKPVF
jgi:hypothetical protein